ncbi:MAG TPA: POTRA domain-containing protein [Terriglobales bacterium]|nr:POTRA domain-containing protein [Terriglobales bacterium]
MGRRTARQFVLLGVIYTLFCSPPICAQFPQRLKRCSPYPTLAEEISAIRAETPHPKVIIDTVRFEGATHLPDSVLEQLIASVKQQEFEADSDWIGELEEVGIRGTWQQQGYFHAKVTAKVQPVGGDSTHERFSVTVHVDEGPQYRLGDIRFVGETVFPPEELRKLIPLREGELFNVAKIRDGIEALRKMYRSKGYIDFVAGPETEVDDVRQCISLVMEVQEGPRFRVRRVEVIGLDPRMETLLRSKLKSGEPFNPELVDDFYKENKSVLPPEVSPQDMEVYRNVRNSMVDLVFDFWTCP